MIRSITVTNYLGDSITIELTRPEKSGFVILGIEGLGPAEANINTTEAPTIDGSRFNSSRVTQRNIALTVLFQKTDNESIEDIRLKSYKYFPIKKRLTFHIETDNRTVETEGYVETNEPTIFSQNEGASISIICPDPYFYSVVNNETVFSGIVPLFEFPFENNDPVIPLIEVGAIENKREKNVIYHGDAEVGITITIHAIGEASDIMIYNTGTREKMSIDTDKLAQITGKGITDGDTITICTVQGKKRATLLRDGRETNILNCIVRGCDWFTLAKGDNIFAYVAETGVLNLEFTISNRIVYEGV